MFMCKLKDMTSAPNHSLAPWTQAWYDYQKSALGESACRQLGFYVIPDELTISVIIPFLNEQATLSEVIRQVVAVPIRKQIVLVDDGSSDGSLELVSILANELQDTLNTFRVESHETNSGKGRALRTGFTHVSGDIVIIQDADLEYSPDEFPRLIQPIVEQNADVVYGSRFLGERSAQAGYYWNYVGNRLITTLSNAFTNLKLTDIETCHKVFRREVVDAIAPKLVSDGFSIEPELTARIARANYRVFEVPIKYTGRTYEEGKKIRFWKDGLSAAWSIVRFGLFD